MTMSLIETKTLASAAASIEFTDIPQDGTDLLVLASIRSAFADVSNEIVMAINGVTTNRTWRDLFGAEVLLLLFLQPLVTLEI